jgi:hypothetical protein
MGVRGWRKIAKDIDAWKLIVQEGKSSTDRQPVETEKETERIWAT